MIIDSKSQYNIFFSRSRGESLRRSEPAAAANGPAANGPAGASGGQLPLPAGNRRDSGNRPRMASTGSSVRACAHLLKPLEGDLLESDADVGKHAYAFRRIQGVLHQLSHRRVQRLGWGVKPRYRFVLREKLRGALLLGYLGRADHLDSSPPPPTPLRSARLRTDRQPRAPFPFAGLCLFFFCLFLVFPREKPEKLDAVFLEPSSLLDAGGGGQRWRPARALALSDAAERGDPIGTTTSSPVDPFAFGPVVTFPCGRLAPTLLVRRAGAPALQKYERAGFVDAKRRPRVRGVGERGVRPRSVQARA